MRYLNTLGKFLSMVAIIMGAIQRAEDRKKEEYESLLNSLASKNAAPKFNDIGRVVDPAFDMNEIGRVAGLLENIEPANDEEWRILIKFCRDKRYCISGYMQSPIASRNYSIGHLCSEVARCVVYRDVVHVYASLKLPIPISVKFPALKQSITESRCALIDNELVLIEKGEYKSSIKPDVAKELVEKLEKLRKDDFEVTFDYSFGRYSWLGEPQGKRER